MTIEEFLQKLQHFHGEGCFNPWGDYDPQCDIGPQAPVIRSANFRRYLELRKTPGSCSSRKGWATRVAIFPVWP